MISENSYFLLRHPNGRYLETVYGCNMSLKHFPPTGKPPYGSLVYRLTVDPFEADKARNVEALMSRINQHYWIGHPFRVVPRPVCACCGEPDVITHAKGHRSPYRCEKHAGRNPCAIEGCTRTSAAPIRDDGTPRLANNQAMCGHHWRTLVPPRSKLRRLYHAHWRRAKKRGWTMKSGRQFDRFWDWLIELARKRATDGHLDMTEINRLMGWD